MRLEMDMRGGKEEDAHLFIPCALVFVSVWACRLRPSIFVSALERAKQRLTFEL